MSRGQKNKLLSSSFPPRLIRIISTPVDIERFAKFETQSNPDQKKLLQNLRQQTEADGRKTILWVGREDEAKDLPTLYKAVRYVKHKKGTDNVKFWMVGKNTIPDDLVDMVTGKGGQDSKDLPAYYYASYLTVLSSSSESFGKVLVEANACGKPVIATATTGAQEIIEDGYNGFLVPINDWKALADKILYLLNHPEKARSMGENGRWLVQEKYGSNTEKIVQLWRDMEAGVI
jgi:glycosyltransferase involved in cell wall biosynthesis